MTVLNVGSVSRGGNFGPCFVWVWSLCGIRHT